METLRISRVAGLLKTKNKKEVECHFRNHGLMVQKNLTELSE